MHENDQDDDSIMRMTRQSESNFQDAETPSSQEFHHIRNNGPRLNRQSAPDENNSEEGDDMLTEDEMHESGLMGEEDFNDMNTQFEMMNIQFQNQGHPIQRQHPQYRQNHP